MLLLLVLSFTKEDHKKNVRCTVKPVYGQPMIVKKMVNIASEYFRKKTNETNGSGACAKIILILCKIFRLFPGPPLGVPQVLPIRMAKYQNETVTLTYETKFIDKGNPPCDTFTWNKTTESNETVFNTKNNRLQFKMDEDHQGNYTCKCSNKFGETEVSNTAELLFLPGQPPATCEYHY